MNRAVLQSSPVQPSMMVSGDRNPSCWWNNINTSSLPPQPFPFHSNNNFFTSPPNLIFPHQLLPPTPPPPPSTAVASSWHGEFNYQDQLPPAESWSQLLMGDEEDKSGLGKKLENWEEHASNNLVYEHGSNNNNNWSQMILLSSPKSSSCVTNNSMSNNNMLNFSSNKPIEISRPPPNRSIECNNTSIGGVAKKARVQPCSTQATFKVRKEKLGDRVTALHQIVSPFGKTDTASVLLEAIGYIRFLQGQIEALSLPYFGNEVGTIKNQHPIHQLQGERNSLFPDDPGQLLNDHCTTKKRKGAPSHQGESDEEAIIINKKDLKSRGLCLVPVSCTMQVENNNIINGADYWTCNFQQN
ncbi:transcription factor bHLH68-like [Impatiens glandulifera]|uniref:transcription factor bHLH68-like n=1 Tax=Impatiens glandulifera TaxID=253017 RepID=UPI001FB192AF|nr:transcription factor bHLH68-like [Impatiens glandulifera]